MEKGTILIIATIACLIFASALFGQQDPDDPGLPDSIIIGSTNVDSTGVNAIAIIPIYLVSDDSIGYYHIDLEWHAPGGGVFISEPFFYYPPVNIWRDFRYDQLYMDSNYVMLEGLRVNIDFFGYPVYCPPIWSGYSRFNFMTTRFVITPDAPRQIIQLNARYTPRMGQYGGRYVPALLSGNIFYGEPNGIKDDRRLPWSFELSQNYPNPFNPSTNIDFSLDQKGEVSLVIYDLLGRKIKTLIDANLDEGSYSVTWDGRDETGFNVQSETYFYRLVTGEKVETKRMTLLR